MTFFRVQTHSTTITKEKITAHGRKKKYELTAKCINQLLATRLFLTSRKCTCLGGGMEELENL